MTLMPHAMAAIVLTIAALILISRARFPLEYSCAGVLVVLVVLFELFPSPDPHPLRGAQLLQGFGNEALITICLLMILARGVEVSGALQPVGRFLTGLWMGNRTLALLATLVVAGAISMFANNTPIVIMLLPILVGIGHRIGEPPSRFLMPVGFATIVGGMATTIGTSTNLLVVNVAVDLGMPRLQMFDFAVPALLAAGVALLYLWLVAPRILPDRPYLLEGTAPRVFNAMLQVGEDSPFAGLSLTELRPVLEDGVRITRIVRNDSLDLARLPTLTLVPGDRVHLRGPPEAIRQVQEKSQGQASRLDRAPGERLVELVVTRDSPLHRKRFSELQRDTLRGLHPVGWHRAGQVGLTRFDQSPDPLLRTGDVLLMQGDRQEVRKLIDESHILVLARDIHVPRMSKAPLALLVMAGVIVVAALGLLPIVASALCGVGIMLVGRCLTWNEAWGAIDTRLALVIVVSLALGATLVGTGAAEALAHGFVNLVADLPPAVILSALLLLTALLTEIVTNSAVAVIATPIAIGMAAELGQPALPFVLAVLFGANMSYLTPIGYQTNLIVMSAGGYRFGDFFRAGLPLQILLWLALSFLLPVYYL